MDPDVALPLRSRGVDVETAHEIGLAGKRVPDEIQLAHAATASRVLVTRDHDFIDLCSTQFAHSGVILMHKPLSIGEMIDYLELIAHTLTPTDIRGLLRFCDW